MTDDNRRLAAEQLAILQRADALERLLEHPGWKEVLALHEGWAEQYAKAARKTDTGKSQEALDALRMWQLAEEFLRLQADYINDTIHHARDIRGTRTLDEALLQEQLQHEQSNPSPGTTDRGGY